MYDEMCFSLVNLNGFLGIAELKEILRNKSKTLLIVIPWHIDIFGGSLFCAFLGEWNY